MISIVIVIALLVVLKNVPLKTITEDYGSQNFVAPYSIFGNNYASTTLIVKKGWTISGSYSSLDNVPISFYILQNQTTVFEKTGSSSGSFSFLVNSDGNCLIKIIYTQYISGKNSVPVTLQAKQSSTTTFI